MKKNHLITLLATAPLVIAGFTTTAMAHSEDKCGIEKAPVNIYTTEQIEHKTNTKAMLKAALGKDYDNEVSAVSQLQLLAGSAIYNQTCAVCHGASGKGDGASSTFFPITPADFTDPKASKFYSDQARIQIIKKGIPGTQMPGWGTALNDEEVAAVYGYVKSLRGQ